MIAACPKCAARFRIERERLQAGGVRLRCSRCEAVFRVRSPEAPKAPIPDSPKAPIPDAPDAPPPDLPKAPVSVATKRAVAESAPRPASEPQAPRERVRAAAPREVPGLAAEPAAAGDTVLLAMSDAELSARTALLLGERGYGVLRVADGVEAMLEIQRKLPRAVVLAADLPKMFGFQICEIVKRNGSLSGIWVVLVGAIHNPDRYRREVSDLYGADAYLESQALPDALLPLLAQGGVRAQQVAPAPAENAPARSEAPPPVAVAKAAPRPAAPPPAREPFAPVAAPLAAPAAAPAPRASGDGLDPERAKAERLARIVVSDIVLYNEERFAAAARAGNVLTAMAADLAEGRTLFEERIDARVRTERDYLKEELLRSAKLRGMR